MDFINDYSTLYTTVLSILTAIITGGFVLIFVEIGNRKNRENDKFEVEFRPFMHKLSAYLRFMSWVSHHIEYPRDLDEHEKPFKQLVNSLSRYGGRLTMSGGDFGIESFTSEKLDSIADDINNVWYWHDKMHPLNLRFDNRSVQTEFIKKELKEINPMYLTLPIDVDLVAKVSGEFYTDIYQLVEHIPRNHEACVEHYGRQTNIVLMSVILVLGLFASMLFFKLSLLVLQLSGLSVILLLMLCLLLLGVDIKKQIRLHYKIENKVMSWIKAFGKPMNNLSNGSAISLTCGLLLSALVVAIYLAQDRYGLAGIGALFMISESLLQIYKVIYEIYAHKAEYCEKLVNGITRCWIIYNILNAVFITSLLYVFLFNAADAQMWGISTNGYFIIILVVSCLISLWSYHSFQRRNVENDKQTASMIYAYAPRMIIMAAFVVYYCIRYIDSITSPELLPALFLVYIGIDRMYNMISNIKSFAKKEYNYMYEDTEKWLKKVRKMEE